MKAVRPYARITVTPKGERALTGGHPWVYEGEVVSLEGTAEDGGLVDVLSRRGSWLGCGFYNSRSKIRVRLVSRNANDDFSDEFWARRLRYAWEYRKTVMGETDSRCCRIIFGEAYRPEVSSRRPPAEEVQAVADEVLRRAYALGRDRT